MNLRVFSDPLRGGKYSFFEGGIRANSFISGGVLPAASRGTKSFQLMHVAGARSSALDPVGASLFNGIALTHPGGGRADWYGTYCGLAGVSTEDPAGAAAGMPAVDSIDMWAAIHDPQAPSPRHEIFMNAKSYGSGPCEQSLHLPHLPISSSSCHLTHMCQPAALPYPCLLPVACVQICLCFCSCSSCMHSCSTVLALTTAVGVAGCVCVRGPGL